MGQRFRRWLSGGSGDGENNIPRQKHTGPKSVKIVLVGDTAVGKSCLIINYMREVFDENYEPSVLDVFKGSMTYN